MTLAAFMRGWLSVQGPSAPAGRTRISGCIYADVKTPLAYRAPTAVEAKAEGAADVEGTACNQAVLGLVAWGDGGYAAAVADAKARSGATQLADVRADTTFFNILFLYDKACTRVTAKAVRLDCSCCPGCSSADAQAR